MNNSELLKNPDCFIKEVPGFDKWIYFYPLNSRRGNELKLFVMENKETQYCIALNKSCNYDRKKKEYEHMQKVYKENKLVPEPKDFGLCSQEEMIYTKLEWLNGVSLDKVIAESDKATIYKYGNIIGHSLRKFHDCSIVKGNRNWHFNIKKRLAKTSEEIGRSQASAKYMHSIRRYIDENLGILKNRPGATLLGDMSTDHIFIMYDQSIRFINTNSICEGDPFYELARASIVFQLIDPALATGLLDGYLKFDFRYRVFQLLAFYTAFELYRQKGLCQSGSNQLSAEQIKHVCYDYDRFDQILPSWYKPGQPKIKKK